MNKRIKSLVAISSALILGISLSSYALPGNSKIAVVDIQQVVEASSAVKALKQNQELKAKELTDFVEKARRDVAKTTNVRKKKNLEAKYNKELNKRRAAMEKDYAQKLAEADAMISGKITSIAQANNYEIVISKNVVLFGGADITETVKNSVKQ